MEGTNVDTKTKPEATVLKITFLYCIINFCYVFELSELIVKISLRFNT